MGRGEKVFDRLLQVVKEGTFPDYRGGKAAYFKEYFDGFTAAIQRADAVVLLGGVGGTYELAGLARQQGCPYFQFQVPKVMHGGFSIPYNGVRRQLGPHLRSWANWTRSIAALRARLRPKQLSKCWKTSWLVP
jgi:hypothetical protein